MQESDVSPIASKTNTKETIDLRDGDSTELITRNPCLPPSERNFVHEQGTIVDEIVDLPGYCLVKVSYEVWTVWDGFDFSYQLDNVSVKSVIGSDCEEWLGGIYNQCQQDCASSGPPLPGCVETCVLYKIEEFQVAIRDYILDKFVLLKADIRICDDPEDLIVKAIFTRASCKSFCLSTENEPISIFNENTVECGSGCCIYQSTYCWDPITGDPVITKLDVVTEISCGEQNTLNDCQMTYGLSFHSPCKQQICIDR